MELHREGLSFDFQAGQYIRITLPDLSNDVKKGNTRDFTIVSLPKSPDGIKIVFRNTGSPFKKFIIKHGKGKEVFIQGPLGVFTLPKNPMVPLIFIVKGMGITPVISMIRYIQSHYLQYQIQILWSYREEEKVPYLEEIREIGNNCVNIRIFEIGDNINTSFIQKMTLSSDKTLWYLCGDSEMIIDLAHLIPLRLDISEENIRLEEHSGYNEALYEYKICPPIIEPIKIDNLEETITNIAFSRALHQATDKGALISITDSQGTIVYCNDKLSEISQYKKGELVGQNHRILKSGFHSPKFYQNLWETILSSKIWEGEIKNKSRDGAYYWVQTTIVPIEADQHKKLKYLSVSYLITEKKYLTLTKQAVLNILEDFEEERNKYAELFKRYELATESAEIGIWEWCITQNTWVASKEFYQLFEATPEEFMPPFEGWTHFFYPANKEADIKTFKSITSPGLFIHIKLRTLLKNGREKIFNVVAKSEKIFEDNSLKLVGVIWDVTTEAKIDQTKSDFISLASHQLRTPLTAIKWSTEILLQEEIGPLNLEQSELIHVLANSAERMVLLVTMFLNISRVESGRLDISPKPVFLKDIIEEVIKTFQQAIKIKNLTLETSIENNLPIIQVDPKLIIEVYHNLVSNAIQYTPAGGKITIELSYNNQEIVSKVSDTGYGIPNNAKNRIFERFFRAENIISYVTDGTGLGLHLSKLLVQILGGKIWFESEENQGTTFTFTVPQKGSSAHKGTVTLG